MNKLIFEFKNRHFFVSDQNNMIYFPGNIGKINDTFEIKNIIIKKQDNQLITSVNEVLQLKIVKIEKNKKLTHKTNKIQRFRSFKTFGTFLEVVNK